MSGWTGCLTFTSFTAEDPIFELQVKLTGINLVLEVVTNTYKTTLKAPESTQSNRKRNQKFADWVYKQKTRQLTW